MISIKSLFNFYINSSIHVSLAIVAFAAVTLINFHVPVKIDLLVFIFLATITGYNFVKYSGIAKLHHISLSANLRFIQIFSLAAFVGLVVCSFFQSLPVLLISAITGALTVLYALPVFSNNRSLRGVPGIKIYVIAIVVAGVTVLMPLVDHVDLLKRDVILEFIQRFLLAIVLVLPLEIRDLKFDMAQLQTIPQKLGVSNTKKIGYILILLVLLLEFIKAAVEIPEAISLLLVGLITLIFLKRSKIRQSKYFTSFWIEAIPIFWLMILVAARIIF